MKNPATIEALLSNKAKLEVWPRSKHNAKKLAYAG